MLRRTFLPALLLLLALPAAAQAIVGGEEATRPHPHMAALQLDGDFICGGSLVAAERILTAAHCVVGEDGEPYKAERLSFVLGRTDRSAGGGDEVGAAAVEVHERYGDPKADSNDVALVTLSRPAAAGAPIALAEPGAWGAGTVATAAGWGATLPGLFGLDSTTRLREVDVPVRTDAECERSSILTSAYDPQAMVCAGDTHGLKDTCQGDSGGPLTVPGPDGATRLAGVTSFGTGCALPTQYGVYAKVGAGPLRDWVLARVPSAAGATAAPAAAPTSPATTTRAAARRTSKASARRAAARRRAAAKRRCLRAAAKRPTAAKRKAAERRCARAARRV